MRRLPIPIIGIFNFMHPKMRKTIPVLLLSSLIVALVNYSAYKVHILIYRAKFNTVSTELMLEIFLEFIVHLALLSVVPLALSLANKNTLSYVALFIISSAYVGFMAGVNLVGPAIVIVILGYLAFFVFCKARNFYNYFRSN